jgi:hypothetical protein
MRVVVVFLMLAGFVWNAFAEAPAKSPEKVVVRLTATIDIDTDGKVAALKWLNEKPTLKIFTNAVTPEVMQWKFEPGTLNGAPAATRTYLALAILAKANEAGGISLTVKAASTGMNVSNPVVPRYPTAGVVYGVNATVRAIVDFDVNGKGTIRSTEYSASRSRYDKHFLKAVTAAVDAWHVEPETVGGNPVAGTVSIPFVFCVQGDWCAKRRAAAKGEDSTTPVVLDSAAKLRSKVEGLSIGSIAS